MVADQAADSKKAVKGCSPYKNTTLRIKLAKELIEFGASKHLLDNHNKRPVDLAAHRGKLYYLVLHIISNILLYYTLQILHSDWLTYSLSINR